MPSHHVLLGNCEPGGRGRMVVAQQKGRLPTVKGAAASVPGHHFRGLVLDSTELYRPG